METTLLYSDKVLRFLMRVLNMAARTLYRINLTDQEQSELERLERGQTTEQHIAKRARIILPANEERLSNCRVPDDYVDFF